MIGRVIFLDVDGVLNETDNRDCIVTMRAPHMTHPYIVNMNTVSILNHVLQQATYLKLVVSSTWREPDNRYERTVNNLQDFCRVTGLKRNLFHTDWRTPLIGDGRNRLVECEAWLNEHPEVFKALAIDDNYSDQFKTQSIIKYIKTDPRKGLTANNINTVLNFFEVRTRADYTVVTAGGPMPI